MYEDPMYEDLLARELRNQAYARVDARKHASPRSASARSPLSDLLNDDYADQLRRARRAAEIEQEAYEYAVREVLGDRGGADVAAARRAEDEESRLREAIAAQEAEIRAAEAEIRRRREVESVEREIAAQEAEIRAAEAELRRREEAEKRDDEELRRRAEARRTRDDEALRKTTEPSLYAALGVENDATDAELKKAFRRLCLKHHPDKGGDAATFSRLRDAYGVLGDARKRAVYDARGDAGLAQLDAAFDQAEAPSAEPPPRLARATRAVPCDACDGAGDVFLRTPYGGGLRRATCSECDGAGVKAPPCRGCRGAGEFAETATCDFDVPPGAATGDRVTVKGSATWARRASRATPSSSSVDEDPLYDRRGSDLVLKRPVAVDLRAALAGRVDVAVPRPGAAGGTLRLRTHPGVVVAPGRHYAAEGLGLPFKENAYLKGKLVVAFDALYPYELPPPAEAPPPTAEDDTPRRRPRDRARPPGFDDVPPEFVDAACAQM
ncbi:hypothetical protein JL720_4239 [Aureococcus anophagefferens]|nr:hypothetical protein JL720_4239 [Aureococcus anophagefferens]